MLFKIQRSPTTSVHHCTVFLIVFVLWTTSVNGTVDLGLQVLTGSRCRVGTVFRPASCTRCICGLFNFMLCSQTCVPTQDDQSTNKPQGNRPTGPTTVPILIPSIIIRQPFSLSLNESDTWKAYLHETETANP